MYYSFCLWPVGIIGLLAIIRFMVHLIDRLHFHLTTPARPLALYKRPGPDSTYALVTGASAGIGYGIAKSLVNNGFGVILLGHVEDELVKASVQLKSLRADAAVKTIVMDARTATVPEMEAAIKTRIEDAGLQVSVLVNNVGSNPVEFPPFRALSTYSAEDVDNCIDLNARFMARLTSMMLPILRRQSSIGITSTASQRSLVLNISSGGMIGSPWLVMYSATKAFNWSFSISLSRELQASEETKHVDSLCVVPGDVRSQGNSVLVLKGSPDSETFGNIIVNKVDGAIARGWREVVPYWLHDLQVCLLQLIPEGTRTAALVDVMGRKRDAFNAVYPYSKSD